MPFYPTGLAFERYEVGVLFSEMLKRFSQEKYEEGWKREYLNKIHKKGERYKRISYWQDELMLETGILRYETGMWWRYQKILRNSTPESYRREAAWTGKAPRTFHGFKNAESEYRTQILRLETMSKERNQD